MAAQPDREIRGFITANYSTYSMHCLPTEEGSDRVERRSTVEELDDEDGPDGASVLAMPLEPNAYKEATEMLERAGSKGEAGWDFDAFALSACTGDHALMFLGYYHLRKLGQPPGTPHTLTPWDPPHTL